MEGCSPGYPPGNLSGSLGFAVGGDAQTKTVKSVSELKLGLSQFRELASFAQFGSDLDEAAPSRRSERGQRLTGCSSGATVSTDGRLGARRQYLRSE